MDQPMARVEGDGDAEFFGEHLVFGVVVAALAGGVFDAACGGQGVGGLVQQGAEDVVGGAAESFAADHDFGALPGAGVPAAGGVVAPDGLFAVGAGRDDDDHGGDFAVPGADGGPDVFQHADDGADGRAVRARGGERWWR